MKPWKEAGSLEGNPIGLERAATAKLVKELDAHLASSMVLYHQYLKHHWLVEGPQFMDLHLFLGKHYEAVAKQADQIAERITALGGIPTCDPVAQAKIAYVEHEPEGAFRIRPSLELDRAHEGEEAKRLRVTVRLAEKLGDYGTSHLLKEILLDVEDRAHHLDHFLGQDSLEIGRGD
jgi:starvation-inducible DNA-binding protein